MWPRAGRQLGHPPGRGLGIAVGVAERVGELAERADGPRGHEPRAVRQHHRVRLRMRRPREAHQRLAHGVVDGDAGGSRCVSGEDRAESQVLGARRIAWSPPPRSGWRRAGRPARPPGSPSACRAPRSRGPARSSRWPPGSGPVARSSAPDRPPRARGAQGARSQPPPGCGGRESSPLPRAWWAAPPRAARSRPRWPWPCPRTRPPPSATRDSSPVSPSRSAEISSTRPGGTWTTVRGAAAQRRHQVLGPLGGEQRVLTHPRLVDQPRAPRRRHPPRSGRCARRRAR